MELFLNNRNFDCIVHPNPLESCGYPLTLTNVIGIIQDPSL